MSVRNGQASTSFGSGIFEEDTTGEGQSSGASPTGSNIFIVKPTGADKSRVNEDTFRHEPVTHHNFGRAIFRGIRCESSSSRCHPIRPHGMFSTLGNAADGEGSRQEQGTVRENNHPGTRSLLGLHRHSVHQ